ncbi:family c-likeg- -coupled receptor protein [Rutstroemia sp. NJR-2017a WRK4]|nr:family c-likeg- -coupled receptor protein [Rutstroemia sp. NJR-2017a WRK4]
MTPSPPYEPLHAALGLVPTPIPDIPISSVFLILFLTAALAHITLLRTNRQRSQKFLMSGMLFGFSVSRVISCILRIAWSVHRTNMRLALAAQVFVAAGVVLLFLINMIFTSRLLRASHPGWAWKPVVRWTFRGLYVSLFASLVTFITAIIYSFFTMDPAALRRDRVVQLVVGTYLAVCAFLPIPLLALRLLLPASYMVMKPKERGQKVEKFGTGRFRTKIRLVLGSSLLLSLGACFRAGIAYMPRDRNDPAWYQGRACFYVMNFGIEAFVVWLYAAMRVDRRFIVPNGTKRVGDFRKGGAGGLPVRRVGDGLEEVEGRWKWLRGWKGEWVITNDEDFFAESESMDVEGAVKSGEMTPETAEDLEKGES